MLAAISGMNIRGPLLFRERGLLNPGLLVDRGSKERDRPDSDLEAPDLCDPWDLVVVRPLSCPLSEWAEGAEYSWFPPSLGFFSIGLTSASEIVNFLGWVTGA